MSNDVIFDIEDGQQSQGRQHSTIKRKVLVCGSESPNFVLERKPVYSYRIGQYKTKQNEARI